MKTRARVNSTTLLDGLTQDRNFRTQTNKIQDQSRSQSRQGSSRLVEGRHANRRQRLIRVQRRQESVETRQTRSPFSAASNLGLCGFDCGSLEKNQAWTPCFSDNAYLLLANLQAHRPQVHTTLLPA